MFHELRVARKYLRTIVHDMYHDNCSKTDASPVTNRFEGLALDQILTSEHAFVEISRYLSMVST